jgi:hypothetical protein
MRWRRFKLMRCRNYLKRIRKSKSKSHENREKHRVGKSCFFYYYYLFFFQRGNNGLVSHLSLVVEERADIDAVYFYFLKIFLK